jgi:outer membrane protein OmpA-like peptidoglycan-associated protein
MNVLTPCRFAALSVLLSYGCFGTVLAQDSQQSLEAANKQLDIDRQKLELEKRELELQREKLKTDADAAELWKVCERLQGERRKQLEMEEAARKELQLKETEKTVTMRLEGDVLFDFDKAEVKPEAERTLDKVGNVIAQFPEGRVVIVGYTDSKGTPNTNLQLSARRAAAVKAWLVKHKNVPESVITTEGFGEASPVAPNANADGSDNPHGRQQNRRVEITVDKS